MLITIRSSTSITSALVLLFSTTKSIKYNPFVIGQRKFNELYYRHHCMYFSRMTLAHNSLSTSISSCKTSTSTITNAPPESNSQSEAAHVSSVYWFRNALRLHDNPSFLEACQKSKTLVPLVIIDPKMPFAQTSGIKPGRIRMKFILQSLQNLQSQLQGFNSSLIIVRGPPEYVLPKLIQEMGGITHLYYEKDSAAPIRKQDQKTLQLLPKHLTIQSFDTHTLFEMEKYVSRCPGQLAPSTFGGFTKLFHQMGPVPSPVETISYIPPLPQQLISTVVLQSSSVLERYQGEDTTNKNNDTNAFPIPTLKELGYLDDQVDTEEGTFQNEIFPGGETEALQRLNLIVTNKKLWVAKFEKPKTSPNSLQPDTTGLSPYIKHGCLSARTVYHEIRRIYDLYPNQHSKPPVSLEGQLMWREYNTLMGYTTPNFDRMVGNPIARQIPWDNDPMLLDAWKSSQTGYPFIDAIMAQLKHTGWIHHLARHAVACFLTRGDLWQSWEKGALYFEEALIDADWSINNFNWQWLSCTAHFYQYFRCYSPIAFGKKTDPQGNYIRKWLPLFRNFPTQYIYEPWKAPLSVQQKTGVIIGKNYPPPLVDHSSVSKANMSRMKQAYDAANNNTNNNLNVPNAAAEVASEDNSDHSGDMPSSLPSRVRNHTSATADRGNSRKRAKPGK